MDGAHIIAILVAALIVLAICAILPPHEMRGTVVKRRQTQHEHIDRYRGVHAQRHLTVDILLEANERVHTYSCDGSWFDRLHEGATYTLLVKGRHIAGIKHDKPIHTAHRQKKNRKKKR